MARLATASTTGEPDVAAVTFAVDADTVVSGGSDISKTVRHGNLMSNPRAVIVIGDLASTEPWTPRGIKIRGGAAFEEHGGRLQIRIAPEVIWSWGLNADGESHFLGVQRRSAHPVVVGHDPRHSGQRSGRRPAGEWVNEHHRDP